MADVRLVTVIERSWCSHTTPVDCVVATDKRIDFKPPDFSSSVSGGHALSPVLNSRSSTRTLVPSELLSCLWFSQPQGCCCVLHDGTKCWLADCCLQSLHSLSPGRCLVPPLHAPLSTLQNFIEGRNLPGVVRTVILRGLSHTLLKLFLNIHKTIWPCH